MSGKLFSIKADPMVPHCTHDSFRSMKLRWCEGEVIVVPSFYPVPRFPGCQHKDPLSSSEGILFFYMSTFLTKQNSCYFCLISYKVLTIPDIF